MYEIPAFLDLQGFRGGEIKISFFGLF